MPHQSVPVAPAPSGPIGRGAFALIGLVVVGLTVGLAEMLSAAGQRVGVLTIASSPLTALGNAFIAATPGWLERWAIKEFGVDDKKVLLIGMALTFALVALVVGLLARSNLWWAFLLVCGLVALTLTAVWTRTGSGGLDGVPTLVGSFAGTSLLNTAAPDRSRPTHERHDPVTGPRHERRRFLRLALLGSAVAALTATVSRLIPSTADVEASRAAIKIPAPVDPLPPQAAGGSGVGGTTRAGSQASAVSSSSSIESPVGSTSPLASAAEAPPVTVTAAAPVPAPTRPLLPSSFDSIKGMTPFVTGNPTFYRIDTTLTPPLITARDWTLRIHGMVAREMTINFLDLIARPQIERDITLACVSNYVGGHLVGNASWIGAPLAALLAEAGPRSGADCVLSTSIDGFTCSTPLGTLTDGRDAILAVAMNGEPLPIEHGFPVRMVVPGLYGYVSATKWVVDLELTTFGSVTSYWTARGWSDHGPVKVSSRIDVPAPASSFTTGDTVILAGVAWAQHEGITAVQVQVDNGPWKSAELAAALSKDTWRQWRFAWVATTGAHVVRCRAIDGRGVVQNGTDHDPLPDGATGYASTSVRVS